jgi:hypothetical protein
MTREQYWRKEYRRRRYLEYLNDEDLAQRLRDIAGNYLILSDNGQMSFQNIEASGKLWIRLFTHVDEEYKLRNKEFPPGLFKGAMIPKPTWPDTPKAARAIGGRKLIQETYLVKYGQSKYLRPMLEQGILRIAPASAYNDPSLNPAIKDNELEISWLSLPSQNVVQFLDSATGKPKRILPVVGNLKYLLKSPNNYYVICLSQVYELRLFDDFSADCCLLINHPLKFIERVFREFSKRLPGWEPIAKGISYVDPFYAKATDIDTYFWKHFRYWYQREYRLVWLPTSNVMQLEPIVLELGNLHNCCELIVL